METYNILDIYIDNAYIMYTVCICIIIGAYIVLL